MHRLPHGRAQTCRRTTSRCARRSTRGCRCAGSGRSSASSRDGSSSSAWRSTTAARPDPTGELETIDADTLVLAIGQNVDLSVVERAPGVRVVDRVVEVDAHMMTGHPGLFAGGDMVPCERTIAVAVGHGAEGGAQHRRMAARRRCATPRPSSRSPASSRSTPGTTGRPIRRCSPRSTRMRRRTTFDEVHGGARRGARAPRGAAVPVVRPLLRVRQLLRHVPGQRDREARSRARLSHRPRLLQGLRHLRQRMPLRRDRDGGRGLAINVHASVSRSARRDAKPRRSTALTTRAVDASAPVHSREQRYGCAREQAVPVMHRLLGLPDHDGQGVKGFGPA